eukprot:349759-Chlamydomonas_euryale.AAC.7
MEPLSPRPTRRSLSTYVVCIHPRALAQPSGTVSTGSAPTRSWNSMNSTATRVATPPGASAGRGSAEPRMLRLPSTDPKSVNSARFSARRAGRSMRCRLARVRTRPRDSGCSAARNGPSVVPLLSTAARASSSGAAWRGAFLLIGMERGGARLSLEACRGG